MATVLAVGSLSLGSTASGDAARDPAEIVAWVDERLPTRWREAIGPVTWHVGDLFRAGSAMEADCSGGVNDGPLIGFSTDVYNQATSTYWRQAYAHEYGHVVLCHLLAIDQAVFDAWTNIVGPVDGAPNHVEMFAQCWAAIVVGTAPRGYDFRCDSPEVIGATRWIADAGPPPPPRLEAAPVVERASSAPPPPPTLPYVAP